ERLDRVVGGADDQPPGLPARLLERPAHLDDEGEQEAQQQQVPDDPRDVGQAALEDEEREDPAAQGGKRDPPVHRPRDQRAHTVASPSRGAASRAAMRSATTSRLTASMQSMTA